MDDFLRRNASQRTLEARQLLLDVPFELVSVSEIYSGEDTFDAWRNFKKRWPNAGGFFDVSAVGFDGTRTRAIVYMGYRTGPAVLLS